MNDEIHDLFIIGGGVNGCAIARDAAGRGLSVALAEKGDIACETSSKSTKLFHGGLRYLEYFEFSLVRHALVEREILLRNMPHIAWPMRFVLPYTHDMRFEADTPASKLLSRLMPWMKGRRPAWMIRLGLWGYDHMGGRKILPATQKLDLRSSPEGTVLHERFETAYEYSDVWAQDSRLVALMARDAHERGAMIMPRNRVISVERGKIWTIKTENGDFQARKLINAAGPWVEEFTRDIKNVKPQAGVRLVKGSHIIAHQLFDHDKSYFFQGTDGRIIFAIPYEGNFTLIGTTDQPHQAADIPPICSDDEANYLCDFANQYFQAQISPKDIVSSYAGVRPLYDDGAKSATAATREYVLKLHDDGAPLLNIFGGKITTHRKLAEDALEKLGYDGKWTAHAALSGGDFDVTDREALIAKLSTDFPNLAAEHARRIFSCYGLEAWEILGQEWGTHFGHGLYGAEVDHLRHHEFAQSAEDILWRRTKLGLEFDPEQTQALVTYLETCKT